MFGLFKKKDKEEKKTNEETTSDAGTVLWGTTLKEAARRSDPDNWLVPSPIKKSIEYIESNGRFA